MNLLDRLIVCLPLIIFAAGALIIITGTLWISERTAKSIPKKKSIGGKEMSTAIREIEDKETIVNRAVDKFIKAVTGVHLITSELLRDRHATTAERELLKAAKVQLKLAELALDEEERAVSV